MILRSTQAKGLSALALATIAFLGLSFLIKGLPRAVPGIILWAGLQSMAAFYGLLRALPRSNEAFFSVFIGDALVRLLSLGVITLLLCQWREPFTIPLLTLALVYFVLSILQIPYFYKAA